METSGNKEVRVSGQAFYNAVKQLNAFTGDKSFQRAQIRLVDGLLEISTKTNDESVCIIRVAPYGHCEGENSCAILVNELGPKLRQCANYDITITFGDERISFAHAHGSFSISATESYFRPILSCEYSSDEFVVRGMKATMKQVVDMTGNVFSREVMRNVFLDFSGEKAFAVASDNYTLAKIPMDCKTDGESTILLPNSVARYLAKHCGSDVSIARADKHIRVSSDGIDFVFDDKSDEYPRYNSVIPRSGSIATKAQIATNDVKNAIIECAGKPSRKNNKCVIFRIDGANGVSVVYDDLDLGAHCAVPVPAKCDGVAQTFWVSSYNVWRILESAKGYENLEFGFVDENSAGVVRPESGDSVWLMAQANH